MSYSSQDIDIVGPGVEKLKQGFLYLWSLQTDDEKGSETTWENSVGFTSGHGSAAVSIMGNFGHAIKTSNAPLKLSLVKRLGDILSSYRATQFKNFAIVWKEVEQDIKNAKEKAGIQDEPAQKINNDDKTVIIHYDLESSYGKYKVYIPNITKLVKSSLGKLADLTAQKDGHQPETDQWGNSVYPRFRYFQQDKINPGYYQIHSKMMDEVKKIVADAGYEIVEKGKINQTKPILKVIGKHETKYGEKIVVAYKLPYETNTALRQAFTDANLWKSGIGWMGEDQYGIDPNKINDVLPILEKYVDATALKNFSSKKEPKLQSKSNKPKIIFIDPNGGNDDAMDIKLPYYALDANEKQKLKEIVTFNFPESTFDATKFTWKIAGTYDQYVKLGELLGRYGYDVSDLRKLFLDKLNRGGVKAKKQEGKVDPDFITSIEKRLPDSNFDLYDAQKEGVAFLHSRQVGILGDATGLGKTVELISAAALKMQEGTGPTLVITLKAVQKQFAEEIPKVTKDAKVSLDPMSPQQWTVVYYEMFSNGKKIQEYVDSLKKFGFGIVIFDELHKIKHDTSKRSQNIAELVKDIPNKWGASATVSSNKAMDVRNQLAMIGHYLGRIPLGKFKKEFAGMVPEGYGGAYVEGSEDQQIEAAEKLNKWLHLSGIYIRREKNEVKEMPNLTISPALQNIDLTLYHKETQKLIGKLSDPDLAISVLGAVRQALAISKTSQTATRALQLAGQGKKTVIFTCFVEAGKQLIEKIKSGLVGSQYVLTYTSDTSKKELNKVKERFTNDPNAIVLIMSMKMGGTGIDFPNAAQNMLINDYDWTPEQAEQSEGRIYRINTIHPVNIEYTIAAGTADEDLFTTLEKKRKIASIIQRYRKDYLNDDDSALQKIISARKQMSQLDREAKEAVAKSLSNESTNFKGYIELAEQLKNW